MAEQGLPVGLARAIGAERQGLRLDIHGPAERARAVEDTRGPAHDLEALAQEGIDIRRVADTELLVIDADAVAQDRDAIARQAADDRLAGLVAGTDIGHTGQMIERGPEGCALAARLPGTADYVDGRRLVERLPGRRRPGRDLDRVELRRRGVVFGDRRCRGDEAGRSQCHRRKRARA